MKKFFGLVIILVSINSVSKAELLLTRCYSTQKNNDNFEFNYIALEKWDVEINQTKTSLRETQIKTDKFMKDQENTFEYKIFGAESKIETQTYNILYASPDYIEASRRSTSFSGLEKLTINLKTNKIIRTLIFDYPENYSKIEPVYYVKCNKPRDSDSTSPGSGSSGTAFFINNDGYLITNYHVVKNCQDKSKISYFNKDISASLIASDSILDLALLKADIKNKNFIKISNKDPEKLQKILVAGYPLGKRLSDDLKLTAGIISSIKGYNDNSNQIQIDAALNPGNSGGPIVDEKTGELVAVAVSAIKSDKIDGINFGIKSKSVLAFLKANNIKEPLNLSLFSSGSGSILKKLEGSAVYTYCRI